MAENQEPTRPESAPEEKKPEATAAAKKTARVRRVWLATEVDHQFDMSGHDLGTLTEQGAFFTPDEADEVRVLALKSDVRLIEDPDKEA